MLLACKHHIKKGFQSICKALKIRKIRCQNCANSDERLIVGVSRRLVFTNFITEKNELQRYLIYEENLKKNLCDLFDSVLHYQFCFTLDQIRQKSSLSEQ